MISPDENSDTLNNAVDDQATKFTNPSFFRFDNFHINQHSNPKSDHFRSLDSGGSTTSNEGNRSLSTEKSSFKNGPKWSVSKKYSLNYASNEDVQKLITEFDAILDKVEKRQLHIFHRMHKSEHWNLIADKVGKKQNSDKSYLSLMYPNMAQFKRAAGTFEGQIIRKQVRAANNKTASHREWRMLYAVLKDNTLTFYKDLDYRRNELPYRDEKPLRIDGGATAIETSSKKRRYLIQLVLSDDSEFMLQCQNISEWARWLAELNVTIKRFTPHTTITTPFGSSMSGSPFKSNVSTALSTPFLSATDIFADIESISRQNSTPLEAGVQEALMGTETQPLFEVDTQETLIRTEVPANNHLSAEFVIPTDNRLLIEAEIHADNHLSTEMPIFTPIINSFVECPHPQLLSSSLAYNSTVTNNIQMDNKTDFNNNDYALVLDEIDENDSIL